MNIRRRALKWLAPIKVLTVLDFTQFLHTGAADTSDFTRLAQYQPADVVNRFAPIKVPNAFDVTQLLYIKVVDTCDFTRLAQFQPANVFNFSGMVMAQAATEVVRFDPLQSSAQISVPTLQKPSLLEIEGSMELYKFRFPSEPMDVVGDVLNDALFFSDTETIEIKLLEPVNTAAVYTAFDVPHISNALDDGLYIPSAEIASDVQIDSLFVPDIVSLFKPLSSPHALGRDYRENETAVADKLNGIQPTLIDSMAKCSHGMVRSQCEICLENQKSAARRRNEPKTEVVNVFEQLRYILQPPILPFGDQPVIFPNGEKPYPFQIAGVNWLVEHKQGLLADQMGLGKTVQAITAMRVLFRRGELQRVLVVCPASMTNVWEREVKSWAPELRPLRVQGDLWRRETMWGSHAEIYIVSYETLRNDIEHIPPDRFSLCVLDEAQKIKNPSTQSHRAVKSLTPEYRWALTGTPIENSVDDVVALFGVIKPGLFYDGNAGWYSTYEVRRVIEPYLLRRTIEDTELELPERTYQHHWLDLLPSQQRTYEETEAQRVADIKSLGVNATRIHILGLITQLKQICNYDALSGQSCKLNFLQDELEVLTDNNDKALVFSQYPNKTLKEIEPKLHQFAPIMYDGSLSATQRTEAVDSFQESDDNKVLLMSVRAGGVGLTLTRANHVFHFDHWWNPAIVDQASARADRIGQNKPVFVHSLYAADTIEERIYNLLREKRALFNDVFGGNPAANDEDLQKLTDEDLFGLFGLEVPSEDLQIEYHSMSPTDFEESICTLFEHLGYRLSVTKKSHDGGIDLDGYRVGFGGGRVIVQCKRYKGTVPVSDIRDLFGVISSDHNIEKGFLVTTGDFSRNGREFARGKRIELINGIELQTRFANIPSNVGSQ